MHPALSVILFTSASGAGYAMLALLGLFGASGVLSAEPLSGWVAFVVSLGMVTHRPRLLDAASRPSGAGVARLLAMALVLAVARGRAGGVHLPAGRHLCHRLAVPGRAVGWAGLLLSVSAFATVCATAMIYASLKPIRAWHNLWTLPGYLAMGLASGALWFTLWAELMPAVQKPAYDFAAIGLARRRSRSSSPTGNSSIPAPTPRPPRARPASAHSARCGC